jgi:fructose-bisphosphate aldolase, class II
VPLTLRQIRDNTQAARGLMMRAKTEGFAVGAFNLDNQETLKAVVRAAIAKKSPVRVRLTPWVSTTSETWSTTIKTNLGLKST